MSPQVTGKLVFLFGLFVLVFTFKLQDHVPDLGRVAPDWWRLSHISEGQNNPILAFALCPCLVHALDTWKKKKKKKNKLRDFHFCRSRKTATELFF